MCNTSVAVCGCGFVGGNLSRVFAEKGLDVYCYDKSGHYPVGTKCALDDAFPTSVSELIVACEKKKNFSKIYFLCLPTPMFSDGECDTSIIESVLEEFSDFHGERIIVIKSTCPPGSIENWNEKYNKFGMQIIHSPEFLREATALEDTRNQDRIILGGIGSCLEVVEKVFNEAFPGVPVYKTSAVNSCMIKYMTNLHLTTRLVLSCEFYEICEKLKAQGLDVSYNETTKLAQLDKRLGGSHMQVPGVDGIRGARGHCFPKDTAEIVFLSKKLGIEKSLLSAVQEKNLSIVPPEHRDWEKMVGRAYRKR